MAIRGFIGHIDLNVADVEASIAFYDLVLGHLGFTGTDGDGRRREWSITYPDGATFAIEVRPPARPAPRDRHERYSPGLDHLAFHAASREDVDRLHDELVRAGHAVADAPAEYDYSPGYYAVAFDDPSGIRIEVVHDPRTNP